METAEFTQSRLLAEAGFTHAFFTRNGGVSSGPYASLNFSYAAGDSRQNVERNLARAAYALRVEAKKIYFLSQVHGVATQRIHGNEDREVVLYQHGDAISSACVTVAVGVRIADCAPVLVADRKSGAAVAIHAGWRGAVAGVVKAGVQELREVSQSDGDLVAAIGPHISLEAFEVGEEVALQLEAASPVAGVVARQPDRRPHVDLRRILHAQLNELGLEDSSIDEVGGCTFGDEENLFSYRRDGRESGRHLAAIVPRA